MTNTLTIRADCSSTIGTGHVMRMIALGQAWQDLGGNVRFVGDFTPLANRLKAERFVITPLSKVFPAPDDLDTLLAHTSEGDWIALDGYHFDTAYQEAIRETGRKTLVLDDICDRGTYLADLLLNQNPDAHSYDYIINNDATLLLGSQYALLRKEFLEFKRTKTLTSAKGQKVLITLGGADPVNMTERVLDAVDAINHASLHLKIIVGAANPYLDTLRKKAFGLACSCDLMSAVNDMPALMDWADLAVSAAGSTCWELAYFGVPFIAIKTADNQKGILNELNDRGVALCLDTTASLRDIATGFSSLVSDQNARRIMSSNGQTLVDGKGAMRVAKAIYTTNLRLRPARIDDCQLLLDWRNDPQVKANSFNSEKIELAGHQEWYKNKLKEETCLFFIAEDGKGIPVGQIRFDKHAKDAEISISVAPTMVGRGIGTTITKLGCIALQKIWAGISVFARVKHNNYASVLMFEKAGFTKDTTTKGDHLRFTWSRKDND